MEQKSPGNMERLAIESLNARIELGADQDLLDLFGQNRDNPDDNAAEIDSGREELFAQGVFTLDEQPPINAANPEVLAVTDHGEVILPAFQFESTGLHPVVAEVNRIIKTSGEMSPWEHAFWWISNTNLLNGQTPLEVMMSGDYSMLVEAAKQEIGSTDF